MAEANKKEAIPTAAKSGAAADQDPKKSAGWADMVEDDEDGE